MNILELAHLKAKTKNLVLINKKIYIRSDSQIRTLTSVCYRNMEAYIFIKVIW